MVGSQKVWKLPGIPKNKTIGFRRQAVNFRSQQVFCKAPLRTEAVWTFLLKTHQPTLCQVPWLWHRFVFCLGIFCRIPMYGIRVKLMKIYINRWWNLVTWLINQDCFPTLKSMIIRACTKVISSFFAWIQNLSLEVTRIHGVDFPDVGPKDHQ